jgi:transaldolase
MNQLEQLKQYSVVVADTGNVESIAQFSPRDATTNPSLILKAAKSPEYRSILTNALSTSKNATLDEAMDAVIVQFGLEILKNVSGRVSSEVDARLSFDTEATVKRARNIFARYQTAGISGERVLIKIAATWEGIQAAKILATEGIRTNLTLVFNLAQAIACADAKVQLISPFVGRIYDWHKKSLGAQWDNTTMSGANDPGVKSVAKIYDFYKSHGIQTEIMAASFRNIDQVISLAGCDLLTISPALLEVMQATQASVTPSLKYDQEISTTEVRAVLAESQFRLQMNRDPMATEKLAEGIRLFEEDTLSLEALVIEVLSASLPNE